MTKIHRPERFPLRTSFLALLTLLPVWAGASSFEKAYTESMIVPDSITMAEAKHALIDRIRLDALNDAGARLKNTSTLIQTGTTESNPISVFSQTMVSLIHVGQPNYTFNKNTDGQIELVATASVSVDDAELQKADDAEREATRQKQRITQLERENVEMRNRLQAMPKPDAQTQTAPEPVAAVATASQTPMPYVDEIVGADSTALPGDKLSQAERNSNTLDPAQQVRFDQLCERFKAVDDMILKDGVQTAYVGPNGVKEHNLRGDDNSGNAEIDVHSNLRVTWDWTADMQIIRHLMGDVGTISDNTYIVQGSDVNDKALLVAVRKCERANHFTINAGDTGMRAVYQAFSKSMTDPNGKTYRLVFKGDYTGEVMTYTARSNGKLMDDAYKPVAAARIADNLKFAKFDSNRLFGTDHPADPVHFGDEERKAALATQQAQANQQKSTPKHSGFVSFFGRMFAAGITGNTMDPAKCAEYGGVLAEMERPGSSGVYFSCQKAAAEGYGGVIRIVPPLPKPAPQTN